ncbi:CDP-glycerol glycerophosphotransferase family protein [Gramella sp. AN32]|uniref:CDP-glycerol glycerophosphotransferase family protein n=1 Tax=Christiangramia antarctica TaxID=2058158 RepID=A0ABW5X606_9FLAO|nr:CDP-glycerol glycerophosphotransferase family protein [Gramella sp. AN32]MCM4154560.1 hypothetical protein [Gramella sp. AN32]
MKPFKIAFLFLDEIHHIYHFITVAIELSRTQEVSILTHPKCDPLLFKSLKELGGENVKVEKLKTSAFRAFTDKLKKRELPRKGFWIRKNQKYILNNFDAIVFSDFFHRYFLKNRKKKWLKLLKFDHGAPGRSYSYNEKQLEFDFQLLYGEFMYEQFKKMGILGAHPVVAGYPKHDAIAENKKEKFFGNAHPTIIYNPHFDPEVTSWKKSGLQVLNFFYEHPEYNLIFAPHLHLFQELKGGHSVAEIGQKYFNANNILIDLGSPKSVDMSYVNSADIYLGDVSSQVYEFIHEPPRPCIFLNPNHFDYKNDIKFRFWKLGEVIENVSQLEDALENIQQKFEKNYLEIQKKIDSENFYSEPGSTASERAAKLIIAFLEKERQT